MKLYKNPFIFLAILVSLAWPETAPRSQVEIKRIVATVDGLQFIYIPSQVITACDVNIWGTTFGVLNVPNKEMYSQLLAAKSQNRNIRFTIVRTDAGIFNIAWTGSTPCRIDYADVE